jgi:hypothetical protein
VTRGQEGLPERWWGAHLEMTRGLRTHFQGLGLAELCRDDNSPRPVVCPCDPIAQAALDARVAVRSRLW